MEINEIQELIQIIDRLLAPNGCTWDREQTLHSMRSSLVEETYELIEAIDLEENELIEEELGDLLFLVLFLSRLAEKEGRSTLKQVATQIGAKLIRRHPHIFCEANVKNSDEVLHQWEEIKKKEKKRDFLRDLPKDLPTLARAQKIAKKIEKNKLTPPAFDPLTSEDEAGEFLWKSVQEMTKQGIEPEQALRKRLTQVEAAMHKK